MWVGGGGGRDTDGGGGWGGVGTRTDGRTDGRRTDDGRTDGRTDGIKIDPSLVSNFGRKHQKPKVNSFLESAQRALSDGIIFELLGPRG